MVNYEGYYDHYGIGSFGFRVQNWVAYLNGQMSLFYDNSANSPDLETLVGMQNGTYAVKWMNYRTGEYTKTETITIHNGAYCIPGKTDSSDWALTEERKF